MRNNLKQLGLAMHNYVCAWDMLPNCGYTPQDDYSPLARLLPYCEQENLYALIDFRINTGRIELVALPVALRPAAKTVVPLFLCSSDSENPVHDLQENSETITYAGSNYAINGGSGTGGSVYIEGQTDGICYRGATLRPRDIADGTTNTLAFAETLIGPGGDLQGGGLRLDVQTYRALVASPPGLIPAAQMAESSGPSLVGPFCIAWDTRRAVSWLRGYSVVGPVLTGRFTPNSPIPDLIDNFASGRACAPAAATPAA